MAWLPDGPIAEKTMPDCLIAQVDAHNLVLRFNGAPTAGFEPVVGSKTSLSMLNTQAMGQILERCSPASTCVANACRPR